MRRLTAMRLELDPQPHALKPLVAYAVALAVAFALVGALFAAYGVSPLEAYGTLLHGTLADSQGLAEVFRRTIPLLLIGSGLTLASPP